MRKNPYENRLKWKLFLLIGMIVLLIGFSIFQLYKNEKDRKSYENFIREIKEQEEQQEERTEEEEEDKEEPPSQSSSDTERNPGLLENTEEEKTVAIINLNEYAAPVMGENAYLLERSLASWVEDKQLNAASASIFHVMVPESDPQSVSYYIKLEDKKGSLVMLSYHPRENVVTASVCNYTEEEVLAEVWEKNGPAQRDVSSETDAEFRQEQEASLETSEGIEPAQHDVSPEAEEAFLKKQEVENAAERKN